MKKEDIFEALGDIDADAVLSAAPKMPTRKKSTFVLRLVAVAACIALLVSAVVVSTLLLNREDENQPDVPSDVTEQGDGKVKYVIYRDFQTGSLPTFEDGENYTLEAAPMGNKNFSFSNRTKVEKPNDTQETLTLKLQGKEEKFEYVQTFSCPIVANEKFSYLGILNEYTMLGKKVRINASTKELLFYADAKVNKEAEGDFTQEQAKEMAEKILVELYGEDALEYYTFDTFLSSGQEKVGTIGVKYVKKVFGFSTDDDVLIKFNAAGELISINSNKRRSMERADQDITKEQIEAAIKVLKETYPSWNMTNPQLLIDSEGDYYLSAHFTMRDQNGFFYGFMLYMNIE